MSNISEQICQICDLPKKIDFTNIVNYVNLQNLLIDNEHSIGLEKGNCYISNGFNDFIDDGYDTYFEIYGEDFLHAVKNYLTLWIEQSTSFRKEDGTMSKYIDTSHTLTREECYYPDQFDESVTIVEQIKQKIKEYTWIT